MVMAQAEAEPTPSLRPKTPSRRLVVVVSIVLVAAAVILTTLAIENRDNASVTVEKIGHGPALPAFIALCSDYQPFAVEVKSGWLLGAGSSQDGHGLVSVLPAADRLQVTKHGSQPPTYALIGDCGQTYPLHLAKPMLLPCH